MWRKIKATASSPQSRTLHMIPDENILLLQGKELGAKGAKGT